MSQIRIASWPGPRFSANEIIRLFCEGLVAAGGEVIDIRDPTEMADRDVHVFQIHWPEQVFWWGLGRKELGVKVWRTLAAVAEMKRRGVRIVWMVHNLAPHDMRPWQRLLWCYYQRRLCGLVDGFLTLSPSTPSLVRKALPGLAKKLGGFVWHPAYPHAVQSDDARRDIRAELGFGAETRVFAFLGLIRAYKGVDQLVRAFREEPDADAGLIIAGTPQDADTVAAVAALAAGDPRIRLIFRYMCPVEFDAYLAAADEFVAPLRRYLHSGSIVHALSANRPVLTPQAPFASDLSAALEGEWIRLYKPPLTGRILFAAQRERPDGTCPIQQRMSSQQAGRGMIDFYDRLRRV